jgi:hypothetical protein
MRESTMRLEDALRRLEDEERRKEDEANDRENKELGSFHRRYSDDTDRRTSQDHRGISKIVQTEIPLSCYSWF